MVDLAAEVAREHLRLELPAAAAFAERKGIAFTYDLEALTGTLALSGPAELDGAPAESFLSLVDFHDYRSVPPWWRFVDPRKRSDIGPAAYPKPGLGQQSVFHGNGLVCAPWSRGAYQENGGPHNDWNGMTNWEKVTGYTIAVTIGEMIDRLYRDARGSRGRFAPLPTVAA